MSTTYPHQMHGALPGSPVAGLCARVAAELAGGGITAACPHPATADRLYLPSRTLRCHDCNAEADDRPDSEPGPCAACGADGAGRWVTWLDERARVLVMARLCEACGTTGNVPFSQN